MYNRGKQEQQNNNHVARHMYSNTVKHTSLVTSVMCLEAGARKEQKYIIYRIMQTLNVCVTRIMHKICSFIVK